MRCEIGEGRLPGGHLVGEFVQAITDKQANQMRAEIVGIVPARKSQMESWTKTVPGKSLKYAIADDAVMAKAPTVAAASTLLEIFTV